MEYKLRQDLWMWIHPEAFNLPKNGAGLRSFIFTGVPLASVQLKMFFFYILFCFNSLQFYLCLVPFVLFALLLCSQDDKLVVSVCLLAFHSVDNWWVHQCTSVCLCVVNSCSMVGLRTMVGWAGYFIYVLLLLQAVLYFSTCCCYWFSCFGFVHFCIFIVSLIKVIIYAVKALLHTYKYVLTHTRNRV